MKSPEGWQVFIDAIARQPPSRQAGRFAGLALEMLRRGDRAGAAAQALRARELAKRHGGDDVALVTQALRALSGRYHVNMSTDPERIAAWERAITARIRPGMLVLEIGTGSGILAMLAARAGAEVVTCEKNQVIAAVAEDIVAANGLSDRIEVVAKPVEALRVGVDLPRPADVLMLDLFGDGLFNFAPFATIAAARQLLRDNALVLPMQVSLHAALAESSRWPRLMPRDVAGFDLSGLTAVGVNLHTVYDSADLSLRAAPATVLEVDCSGTLPAADDGVVMPLVSNGGEVNGVAVWIALTLAPGCVLEARPGAMPRGFYAHAQFAAFGAPVATGAGDTIPVRFDWRGRTLRVAQVLRES